jgi:hypothetical protein
LEESKGSCFGPSEAARLALIVAAEATPEQNLTLIRSKQAGGRMVAMTGDGTTDAPAPGPSDLACRVRPTRGRRCSSSAFK